MKVLGIHHGHDANAALIENGRVIAEVAEERFTRQKHSAGAPLRSIEYCLGLTDSQTIDAVAFSTHNPERGKSWPVDVFDGYAGRPTGSVRKLPSYFPNFRLKNSTEFHFVPHHESHAAAAYFTSGLALDERAVVVTMDGTGDDGRSSTVWRAESGKLECLYSAGPESSIGWFYSNVTEALGWWHGDGEGKTMGLAPYGHPDKVRGAFEGLYPRFDDGRLVEPHNFGPPLGFSLGGTAHYHFGEVDAMRRLLREYDSADLAAHAQQILEREVLAFALPWLRMERTDRLLCSGGVFLNVKLNQRIWESGAARIHYPFPNAGDAGLSVGAALAVYHRSNPGSVIHGLRHLYWGPEYSDQQIEAVLTQSKLTYRRVDDAALVAARLLAEDRIVGWFQGRMESGPRALGARSILMSANNAQNKDRINAQVKFREAFRPFCPSLLAERRDEYLQRARDENFMITSFDVTPDKRASIPAVVHVDGTLRPQTVHRDVNPLFHRLIQNFGELTGEYIVLNTSLNVMGEPIVASPADAVRCFYSCGLDALCIGNYVLEKDPPSRQP
jgi:carbamoyltransferase